MIVMKINEIIGKFGIGNVINASEINGGHINTTYLVETADGGLYILQSLSRRVFRSHEAVMKNISKIEKAFAESSEEMVTVPHYLTAEDEANFIEYDGEIYRAYAYTEKADSDSLRKTGYSFGAFIRVLSSRKIKLETTIADFHSFQKYFSALTAADSNSHLKKIDKSIMRRLASVSETLGQVFTVDFPTRNVHNDAKCSNVIIGEISTVIDLDTTMQGYAAIDYGDMIRSVCIGGELDIKAVMELTKGFADGLGGILTDDEVDSLYYGILYVTAELAVRYLTDYLSEDKYFKGKTSAECLKRANELLGQLNMFISGGDDITDIIYKAFGKQ